MNIGIKDAFKSLMDYFTSRLSGKVVKFHQHWEDLAKGNKNTAIFLPDSGAVKNGKVSFSMALFISVFESGPDAIADTQMDIAQILYDAVYPGTDMPLEISEAGIEEIEFYDPGVGAPNVGIVQARITAVIGYTDDCG
jgi:hypothetical protein